VLGGALTATSITVNISDTPETSPGARVPYPFMTRSFHTGPVDISWTPFGEATFAELRIYAGVERVARGAEALHTGLQATFQLILVPREGLRNAHSRDGHAPHLEQLSERQLKKRRKSDQLSFDELIMAAPNRTSPEAVTWAQSSAWKSRGWDQVDNIGTDDVRGYDAVNTAVDETGTTSRYRRRLRRWTQRAPILMVAAGAPLVLGAMVLLGLLWTTQSMSAAPAWLPVILQTPPWSQY